MISDYIGAIISTLFLPVVVLIIAAIRGQRARRRGGEAMDVWVRTWLVGAVALGALLIALTFLFIPTQMADSMGYAHSPFQFEVLGTNLAFAAMAVLAWRVVAYRLVVAIGYATFMWWALLGHVYQAVVHGNLTAGNVPGIWIYDLAVPAVLLGLLIRQRRSAAH